MHKSITMGQRSAPIQGQVFVGTGSRWHNPFEFEEGEEAYLAFKEWFYSPAYAAIRLRKGVLGKLSDVSLICDCGDAEHCHARVLAEYIEDHI